MNKTFFVGNLVTAPEPFGRDDNISGIAFRIAVDSAVYNADKQAWEQHADYFDCTLYGAKRASALLQFLHKGQHVSIEAHARQETWEGSDGKRNSRVRFIVDDIVLPPRPKSA